MKKLILSMAAAAALSLAAAPAYAQNVNTGAQGTFGRVQLTTGFTPDPYTVSVTAGGPVDATRLSDTCVGNIAQRASFTLNYRAGDTLPLHISAMSDGDATLAVRAPDGRWYCNDDGAGGLNPGVSFESPRSGRYQIWVGVFAGEPVQAQLLVSEIALASGLSGGGGGMPDWSLDPAYGSIDLVSGFTPDPHTQQIAAGGELDASQIGVPGCVGAIARAPDYRLNFTAGTAGLPLIFSVASDTDTTLVINDPSDSWACDDDGGEGLNPSIRFDSPLSGQYDIWVGTYGGGDLADSTLHISEVGSQ